MAIDVIDILSDRLEDISNIEEDGYVVKKDTLDKINDEFQKFINQKDIIISTIKDMNKKLMSQIEDMKMPNLSLFLNDKYASIQNKQFNCDICNLPFQNKRKSR
jgi:enoyl reductase-like protein